MTIRIDALLRKWRFYKRCLIVFIVLNVFSISLSLTLGTYFLFAKKDFIAEQKTSLKKLKSLDSVQVELRQFQELLKLSNKKLIADKAWYILVLENWQSVQSQLEAAGVLPKISYSQLLETKGLELVQELNAEISHAKEQEVLSILAHTDSYQSMSSILIVVGICTFIFGYILPAAAIYFLTRALENVRKSLQSAALEFVKSFMETKIGFGDSAFRNAEFWLQILLLVGQSARHYSANPLVQIASEFAYLVSAELKKKSQTHRTV